MTAFSVTGYVNPATGLMQGGYFSTDPGAISYVADYPFFFSAQYSQIKNGFSWSGSKTIGTPESETEKGGLFTFNGNPDPRAQPTAEQRYSFNQMPEFWLKKRFYVPTNYYHRRCTVFTVTGDMTGWQRGDNLLANNGVETGKVEYISGSTLLVLFPTNPFNAQWNGNITNVTRSQTYPCTRVENWPDNNKFHALWCDGYSHAGQSPTIVFELHATGDGGSYIYYHFGADGQVVGTLPNSTSPDAIFIRAIDFGKWFDWIVHVKMATSETAEDGIIEHWVKREGESAYTKIRTQTNCKIGPRAAASNAQFRNGYCHGYQNTGPYSTFSLCDSHFILSSATIDGVA